MTDRLHTQIEPTIIGLGYELLGIERARNDGTQLLRLYIDQPSGITVSDCERVSRQISDLLEAEQLVRGEYMLEVSSPGLDRPLFTLAQHSRFIGAEVAVRLRTPRDGRRRVKGILREVTSAALVVEEDGATLELPFQEVERSRLVPDWPAAMNRGRNPASD